MFYYSISKKSKSFNFPKEAEIGMTFLYYWNIEISEVSNFLKKLKLGYIFTLLHEWKKLTAQTF